jgi:hypothetical protein
MIPEELAISDTFIIHKWRIGKLSVTNILYLLPKKTL